MAMLEIHGIHKSFGDAHILNGVDLKVNKGDVVKKGQIIARTGSTGLAFGDHLHFGILVGGVEVTPLEWIDPKWVRDNITGRLEAAAN